MKEINHIITPNISIDGCEDYPTVSDVLNSKVNRSLERWKDEVGHDVAEYILTKAKERGSDVHQYITGYLNNDYINSVPKAPRILGLALFNQMRELQLGFIDNVRYLESDLVSRVLKIRGRVDCIADFHGELCVIEFKTSTTHKLTPSDSACYQATAYAMMWNEHFDEKIENIVIINTSEDGQVISFKRPIMKYSPHVLDLIDLCHKKIQNDEQGE